MDESQTNTAANPSSSAQLLPSPGQLPELKKSFHKINDALNALRLEAAEYKRNALEQARERIEQELQSRYAEREQQLQAELENIETSLEDEKDRLARAGIASAPLFTNSPAHPAVGTLMIEDEEAIARLKRPARRARVEIVNRDTFHNATNRLSAGLGDVVLRILNRDGSLSDEYAPMDRYRWRVDTSA